MSSNITKGEIISNLKDKISQFKSKFNKGRETRKDNSDNLNFEINRDALKLFYKNKDETHLPQTEPIQTATTEKEIQKNINIEPTTSNETKKIENKLEAKTDTNQNEGRNKINKNFTFGGKDSSRDGSIFDIDEFSKFSSNNNNDNNNKIRRCGSNNLSNFDFQDFSYNKSKNIDNSLSNIRLNNSNYQDFNLDGMFNYRKTIRREKSAPKIDNIYPSSENFLELNPLTIKHEKKNNTKKFGSDNEQLYQKLLLNFNINFSDKDTSTTTNLNSNYNLNKSIGQINVKKDSNTFLYDSNSIKIKNEPFLNSNSNNNNLLNNYYKTNSITDFYTEHNTSKSNLKSKMDYFYKELNCYNNSNVKSKSNFQNFFTSSKKNIDLSNQISYFKTNQNSRNSNFNCNNINFKNNNNIINLGNINKKSNKGGNLSFSEVYNFKQNIKELTNEDFNNLPKNVLSELKAIYNILQQKFSE